ncbi:glucose 1-dehydrogenase [Bradyrhizobium sp. U87765 SZCCT0131]|uniref:SDR family NAD(P)-dependent oxidoreductase n=1 Tax=unclassified Bradyrhizobium TaxID=2631580 RepID=UPI001BADCE85|nr:MULTISPECIES: glucose 1-dehydrogenase [unclassified Bradyrhizobium]MBR1218925.1 glucose 1-dehydrogenase [Bradyrhizobium sp. U87765 SZCCT0131]MBR1261576.1 glucose 1-dehydrogenase [Bradyrhizobium sp. U87765 SZCCT0134]MBR1306571.1 glucose 1-dehydrogenase [Bradyrhizobium sp. U87765 SZCCT0110]MBR1317358.1 glucose 1-dehydrogenase [Bradyrhizobium sp. U87765 SZCCT0109]MBR1351060.1 glucose 1-dehydrogenase [Bradyrhizobium sp. U87765 SZCCT0048]
MKGLKDKAVIVTGAARGIGAAMARGLAEGGAHVAVADLRKEDADAMAAQIVSAGGKAIGLAVDVRKRASVRAMIDATVAAFSGLDVIFNNAGIAQVKPFLEISEEDWQTVLDVNALGVLIGMQEAVKTFQALKRRGKIVNTASIAGKQGYEPLAHYSASKFAVVALTQAAARAFGNQGITANCICPGVVATPMWKLIDQGFQEHGLSKSPEEAFNTFAASAVLGRPSQADDLVGVARFLASSESDFMTGQSLLVDGGMVFT